MHIKDTFVPTSRLEAFSDGVIAIIITVMVFDLKVAEGMAGQPAWQQLRPVLPKFATYTCSFVVLAVMWVNHHQLFHRIRHADRSLLWLNTHLLFWMSFVPFATNFLGANPTLDWACFAYGIIFLLSSASFALLRNYAAKHLIHPQMHAERKAAARYKNQLAMLVYLCAALAAFASVYLSYVLFLVVPAMYFIPEKIEGAK